MTAIDSYTPFGRADAGERDAVQQIRRSMLRGKVAEEVAKHGGELSATPTNAGMTAFADTFAKSVAPAVQRFAGSIFSRGSDGYPPTGLSAFNTYTTGSSSSAAPLVPGVGSIYKTGAF